MARENVTVTMYPLLWYFAFRAVFCFALIVVPLLIASFLIDQLPNYLRTYGDLITSVAIVPAQYFAICLALQALGLRSADFMIVASLAYCALAYLAAEEAFETGTWNAWSFTLVCVGYVGLFGWIARRTAAKRRHRAHLASEAERQAQIEIQAAAIVRARELTESGQPHLAE